MPGYAVGGKVGGSRGGGGAVRIGFRPYQVPVFHDRTSGVLVLHWARQIGSRSRWRVGGGPAADAAGRLVTVLSNSRDNGRSSWRSARRCAG